MIYQVMMATATSNRSNCMSNIAIKIVSFNMHGFNQVCSAVDDMINLYNLTCSYFKSTG